MTIRQHPKVPTLRDYLNNLSLPERTRLEKDTGTTIDYLRQIAGGHRRAGSELAKAIDRATSGEVPKNLLRPDLWEQAA